MPCDKGGKGMDRHPTDAEAKGQVAGRQRILHGDCLQLLPLLDAGSVDVVVTSPPYNIGIGYGAYDDRRPRAGYLGWLAEVGRALHRVLAEDGSLFLNLGGTATDPWVVMDVAAAFRETFRLQNHIVWVKSLAIGNDTLGHFKPVNSRRFLNNNHEAILHLTKTGHADIDRLSIGVPYKDKSNIARWGHARDRRCAGNVWFIPYDTVRSRAQKFDHPAGFPVELPRRCIRLCGAGPKRVLDPFLGAGTTLVAAEELGCDGIGIEIDGTYVATALRRLGGGAAP